MVRYRGRAGCALLLLDLQEFQDRDDQPVWKRRKGNSRQGGGIGDGGRVRARRREIRRLNGGPLFKFSEAISFQIHCEDQKEVDYFWAKLADGGEEGPCGWLKDRYGLSWQVVPKILFEMLVDPDQAKSQRVTRAFLQMKKFDIAGLERAYAGKD
jgi:3-demethylubiquinone-9 3-methyltransferase